jgi:hypothetical protein
MQIKELSNILTTLQQGQEILVVMFSTDTYLRYIPLFFLLLDIERDERIRTKNSSNKVTIPWSLTSQLLLMRNGMSWLRLLMWSTPFKSRIKAYYDDT